MNMGDMFVKYRFRVFKNRVLRRIIGSKKKEGTKTERIA
jgi:hypothetical protein